MPMFFCHLTQFNNLTGSFLRSIKLQNYIEKVLASSGVTDSVDRVLISGRSTIACPNLAH